MQINTSIFKAYDIRGIYPDEVNKDTAFLIGQALATWSGAKEIVVGCDMRISSPILVKAVMKGIISTGANVLDVGLVSTPTFYFAVRHLKASAGIQVSASHNPKEYNGFKIVLRDKKGIIKVGIESGLSGIRDLVLQRAADNSKKHNLMPKGLVRKIKGIQEIELDDVFKRVPILKNMPPLTIVVDSANAMGGPMLEAFFARIPSIKLVRMNFELDGNFPAHQADPFQFETLRGLQERMLEEKADLGIAPDGDADRMFFLNKEREGIPASHITALVAREVLRKHKGEKVLYDVRYSWNAKKVIEDCGGIPAMGRVGHAFISEALRRENGIFAGESSGHYFFRDTGYAEGPLLVLLYVLKVLAREQKSLSEVVAPLVSVVESGEVNFRLDNREKAYATMEEIEKKYKDGQISKLDGLAIEFPDWRFSLRASNTEPLLRLNVEAKTKEIVEEKKQELMALCQ